MRIPIHSTTSILVTSISCWLSLIALVQLVPVASFSASPSLSLSPSWRQVKLPRRTTAVAPPSYLDSSSAKKATSLNGDEPPPSSSSDDKDGIQNSNDVSTSSSTGSTSTSTDRWNGWKDRLLRVSNTASLLCVVDCTILPVVTILLPLLGVVTSPNQAKWLHDVGHTIALYFVLPVGGLATTMNYVTHHRPLLTAMATFGMMLIYAANGNGVGPILARLPRDWVHALHCGSWLHRVTNLVGCACLLGSNYWSHRIAAGGGECGHDHGGDGRGSRSSSCGHDH
mmetsp:Transcript_3453/g.7500  ORF Transcript_3453/g.7500 Transcript_3453/m.7500 type:complete len:283 (+) Transcript_3453:68-916(+)